MGIKLSGPQRGVVMVQPGQGVPAKPAVQPQAPARMQGDQMRMSAAESSRLQKMLAKGRDQRSAVQKVGIPQAQRPQPAPARTSFEHLSAEQVSMVLAAFRTIAGQLAGALPSHWRAYQTAILSGRHERSAVLANADTLLGRMLLSIEKLSAAEREGRGAMISEGELADADAAEGLLGQL